MNSTIWTIINIVLILLLLVTAAAFLPWIERRLLALWQDRYGPNRVGPGGIMQPMADMIKLFIKEDWIPPFADKFVFIIAPTIILFVVMAAFAVIPIAPHIGIIDLNIGLLFFLAMTSLGAYSIMFGAYASNSKYSLLGGLRAAAQMVSYEVFMGLSLMGVVMLSGSFNLRDIVNAQAHGWFIVPQFLGFVIFYVASIAESHRGPFDLPEAEHELAAGFHTEYSGMKFGMFYVGEYVSVILNASMTTVLFLGGWQGPLLPPVVWFLIKVSLLSFLAILVRGSLPRPRYDQLMSFGWKIMLPLAMLNLLITGVLVLWRA